MYQIKFTLLLLIVISKSFAHLSTLEYVQQVIEYVSAMQTGIFSCVFYDIDPQHPFDNILNDLLQSPRLGHVVKYVVNGSFQKNPSELPLHPSMLLIHPGTNLSYLERDDTEKNIDSLLWLFNPLTKVVVVVNSSNPTFLNSICSELKAWHYSNVIYINEQTHTLRISNAAYFLDTTYLPHPKSLFTYMRRKYQRRNLTFYSDLFLPPEAHARRYMTEVARYLNTEAVQYRHNCDNVSELAHARCMRNQTKQLATVDVSVCSDRAIIQFGIYRGFDILFTNVPLISRIVVPRDRHLHPAELMLMPFSWPLWIVLLLVLLTAELAKHCIPNLLRNDPILFVVCGFERHNLHEAGRSERIILQSLIVLMFFASNAYETKIISLMINRPSAQRIKTLEDAAAAGIKFYASLQEYPWQRNDSVIGELLVDDEMTMFDTIPGVGMMVAQDLADIADVFAFDYERGEPWYVLLEDEFFVTCVMYTTSYRSPFLEVFEYVHNALLEAGIWNVWKRRYQHVVKKAIISYRRKVDYKSTIYLDFDDMQLAWIVLAIGFLAGSVAFLVELVRKRFESKEF